MKTNFEVGDKVYCIINGWGTITTIHETGDFPITVSTINDEDNRE
jgi:hypothetical protein